MSKSCKDCRHFKIHGTNSVCTEFCNETTMYDDCKHFEQPTLFDSVTASPDVLADKLVYDWGHLCHNGDVKLYWKSTILPDAVFYSKHEAIAATLEELNKVSK